MENGMQFLTAVLLAVGVLALLVWFYAYSQGWVGSPAAQMYSWLAGLSFIGVAVCWFLQQQHAPALIILIIGGGIILVERRFGQAAAEKEGG